MPIKYNEKLEQMLGENKKNEIIVKSSKIKDLLDIKESLRNTARRRAGVLRDGMGHI